MSHDSPCPRYPALDAAAVPMRAIMQRCYGASTGFAVERIAKPTPGDEQVLIKVHAASINPVEWHMTTGKPRIVLRLASGIGVPE